MQGENESELLARAAKGDAQAFQRIFEAHHAAMFRFAYRVTGVVDSAEDLTQECFVQLMRRPPAPHRTFDQERGSLRQYLYGIVRNLVRQHLQASRREENWHDDAEDDPKSTIAASSDWIISAELTAVVQAAISALPPLQREAIVLCEFEQLSLSEAALVLVIDVGTIKSRLHRAREGLRRRLAPYRSHVRTSVPRERSLWIH